jgi:hypothetical protein
MSGHSDPSFGDLFQVLSLLAIPAVILLALRLLNRRGERTQPCAASTHRVERRPAPVTLRTSEGGPFALPEPVAEEDTRGRARTA